jgi:hypothetical protein
MTSQFSKLLNEAINMTYTKIRGWNLLPIMFHPKIPIYQCLPLTNFTFLKLNQYHFQLIKQISFLCNLNLRECNYLYIAYFGQIHILLAVHSLFAFSLYFLHLTPINIQTLLSLCSYETQLWLFYYPQFFAISDFPIMVLLYQLCFSSTQLLVMLTEEYFYTLYR